MVAEDEAVIRMDLVELLTESGYDVVSAVGNGDAATAAVAQLSPDVALVDIAMPGMDGIEVTRQVNENTAVVIVTAFGQRHLIDQAVQAGAMGYLVKPVLVENLVPAIETAAARWLEAHEVKGQVAGLARRLADRQDVDRAKGMLIHSGMSESEAFALIRRRAMDERTTMGDIARHLLARPDTSE
jgi:AmiR/NasT family two-component response regulator